MSNDDNIESETVFTDLIGLKGLDAARQLYGKPHIKNQLQTYEIHKLRVLLPNLLSFYNTELGQTNPAIFQFLTDSQKEAIKSRLKLTWYLLYSQYQLDDAEDRHHVLAPLVENMNQCNKLLGELEVSETTVTPQGQLDAALNDSEKYLKYTGLTIVAPIIVQQTMDLVDGKPLESTTGITVAAKENMTAVNGIRLFHWVWGGSMISAGLDMLPDDFYNKNQAQDIVSAPAPVMGYMSWILYYTRFGVNLGLLLKHTINGPWMKEEEAQIPAWERFKTQWQQRKFALLNDSIWATANMAGFYWLKGSGTLGYAGNVVTAGLLLMDLSLTIWRFWEESTEHNKTIYLLEEAQKKLKAELQASNETLQTTEAELIKARKKLETRPKTDLEYADLAQIIADLEHTQNEQLQNKRDLEHKITDNNKLIKHTNFEWKYNKYATINDLVYSAGLLVAFSLMCCFFCPPAMIAPATMMIITLAGATICFVGTLASASVAGGIEIAKTQESGQSSKQECEALLQQFKNTTDENTRKMLYLEMKGLIAQSEYQQRMVTFQKIKLVRAILVDALMPALTFVAFLFLPFPAGLAVLAAGLALAALTKVLLDHFEPQADALPCFDETIERDYGEFSNNPDADLAHFQKKSANNSGFFPAASTQKAPVSLDEDNDENDGLLAGMPV